MEPLAIANAPDRKIRRMKRAEKHSYAEKIRQLIRVITSHSFYEDFSLLTMSDERLLRSLKSMYRETLDERMRRGKLKPRRFLLLFPEDQAELFDLIVKDLEKPRKPSG
ncbi:MAG: hypothetical protein WCJ29_02480 [bacterium]